MTGAEWAFPVAVTSTLLLFWTLVLRRFEAHRPAWRMLVRCGAAIGAAVLIEQLAGRTLFWIFIAFAHLPALYIHLWWLPRRGVNGLSAEPYDLYLRLIGEQDGERAG